MNLNYLQTRNHKILAGLAVLLLIVVAVAVAVGTHSNGPAPKSNFYTGTSSPSPVPSNTSAMAAWYNSTGQSDMQTVSGDLGQLQTDADAGDTYSAETDGATLATDAQTAADDPPPVQTAEYINAMSTLETAGNDAADGDFTDATVALDTATGEINSITAYLNANGE